VYVDFGEKPELTWPACSCWWCRGKAASPRWRHRFGARTPSVGSAGPARVAGARRSAVLTIDRWSLGLGAEGQPGNRGCGAGLGHVSGASSRPWA